MRRWSWIAFLAVCNVVGVEVFKAAMTLPFQDALVPAVLTVPLIGLTAFGVRGVMGAYTDTERDE